MENSSLSLQKAEGQGCAQIPWEPQLRAQSAQLSPLLLFSCIWLSLVFLEDRSVVLASLLSLSASVSLSPSLCFSDSISLSSWHRLSYSVSYSQTVSDSLGLWLTLPPSSWLLPKASALPSMLG